MPKPIIYTVAAIAVFLMAGFVVSSLNSPGGDFADEIEREMQKIK
jgi:hypothetical protein